MPVARLASLARAGREEEQLAQPTDTLYPVPVARLASLARAGRVSETLLCLALVPRRGTSTDCDSSRAEHHHTRSSYALSRACRLPRFSRTGCERDSPLLYILAPWNVQRLRW